MTLEQDIQELKGQIAKLNEEVSLLKKERHIPSEKITVTTKGITEELEQKLKGEEDGIVIYSGVLRVKGGASAAWDTSARLNELLDCPSKRAVHLLQCLSSEQRIDLMKALFRGDKTPSDLTKETGVEGGQLYHHLKEMIFAGLVDSESRGLYRLTVDGVQSLFTSLLIGLHLGKAALEDIPQS